MVEGVTLAAGHGLDCGVETLLVDEEGVDEVGWCDEVLLYHVADGLGLAVAAGTRTLRDPDVGVVVGY